MGIYFEPDYHNIIVHCYSIDRGKNCHIQHIISPQEYKRYLSDNKMPLLTLNGWFIYLNEDGFFHNLRGPAIYSSDLNDRCYFIDGVKYGEEKWKEEVEKHNENVYFLREKIICLKNLIEIPELFQEVYYTHKSDFMSLLKKV